MRVLLDTHVWLWVLESPDRLAPSARTSIQEATELFISVASIWEIAIKEAYGKVSVTGGVERLRSEAAVALGARELDVRAEHALTAARLPTPHKDPFDRMLIAQSIIDGFTLVTADEAIRAYGGNIVWAHR